MTEHPLVFECHDDSLIGILHPGNDNAEVAIVFIVGGPQYRAGSHRQFTLMARQIASKGTPVLRFDHRGMGDSGGLARAFDDLDDDIRCAVDAIFRELPMLKDVILLGLCDGASASLIYCASDERISGVIAINPWVRTDRSESVQLVKHYYLTRLTQMAFWRKLFSGRANIRSSVREFFKNIFSAFRSRAKATENERKLAHTYISRMLAGLRQFQGPVMFLTSGDDLTAREFLDLCKNDESWRRQTQCSNIIVRSLPNADHTFSARKDLNAACLHCTGFISDYVMSGTNKVS